MMIQNLAIDVTKSFASAGEALGYGLPLSLFGFCVVFFVLALLWGILTLFKLFFYTIPNNKKKAITAAIEAFRSQNGSVGGFRVVSFKKRK